MSHNINNHVNSERLQAFLEGELVTTERTVVEEHLHDCVRCSADLDAWRHLFSELVELEGLRPHEGFQDRVMAAVQLPERLSLAARLRARLGSLMPAAVRGHVSSDRLQDMLEGFLPQHQTARIEAHLSTCHACSEEAGALSAVFRGLDRLERLEPSAEFAARVLEAVRVRAAAPAKAPEPAWTRVLAWGSRLVPQSREAWAALSGVAVTPAVSVGLLFYAVFSHPTLTPGALASYVWWQVSDAALLTWTALAAFGLESAQASGAYPLFEALAAAPMVVAGGFLIYSLACAFALRVLYRHLIITHPLDGRYAQLSVS
jgi:anti-sigma factor RsiW